MAELVATRHDPQPLAGVARLDLGVLSIRRLRRFGPALPALPIPADLPVGRAARADGLLLVAPAPGEWLLLGHHAAAAALAGRQDPGAFLAIEVSEACAIFRLAPAIAAEALAAYAPIDPATLEPGTATRARFAEMTALLIPEPEGELLIMTHAADADQIISLIGLLLQASSSKQLTNANNTKQAIPHG